MTEIRNKIEALWNKLKEERDELRVQTHLAKLEALEEWDKVEEKLEQIKAKAGHAVEGTEEAAEHALESARHLGEEVRELIGKLRSKV